MYNIDFRVNTQILSIPITLNDTLNKLISRMKELQPFTKYDDVQLQSKLIRSLKGILNKTQLQTNVRQRIIELITNNSGNKNEDQYQKSSSKIGRKDSSQLNEPYQQSSISKYKLEQHVQSTTRLNKKYDLKSYQMDQNYQNSIQHQLKYKYKQQPANQQHKDQHHYKYQQKHQSPVKNHHRIRVQQRYSDHIKQYDYDRPRNDRKFNVSDYLINKKYSYNYQQNNNTTSTNAMMKRSINEDTLISSTTTIQPAKQNQSLSLTYFNNNNNKQTHKQKQRQRQPNNNKSFSQQRILSRNATERRQNIDHLVSLTYKRPCEELKQTNYNPIPKLNQLIDKSRSYSQIIPKKDTTQQKKLYNRDLNRSTNQIKPSPGKIQHRQSSYIQSSLNHIDIKYKQNYLPSRAKPYTFIEAASKISHDGKRTVNTNSFFNESPLQLKNNNYAIDYKQQGYKLNKKVYSYL